MRIAISLLTTFALFASLATPDARACGQYGNPAPAMYLVTEHFGRSFVLLDQNVLADQTLTWGLPSWISRGPSFRSCRRTSTARCGPPCAVVAPCLELTPGRRWVWWWSTASDT